MVHAGTPRRASYGVQPISPHTVIRASKIEENEYCTFGRRGLESVEDLLCDSRELVDSGSSAAEPRLVGVQLTVRFQPVL